MGLSQPRWFRFLFCILLSNQSIGMHSRSVLVPAIFAKNDEQGGEDCLSTASFQIF